MAAIAFIGSGNMAEALINGLLAQKIFPAKQIICCDISSQRLAQLKKKYGVGTTLDAAQAVTSAQTIVLAVKPQQMAQTLAPLKAALTKKHLIITIAAGLPLKFYRKILGADKKCIRVMPNTPAMVNLGYSAFIATKNCQKKDTRIATQVLQAVGKVLEVKNEAQIDAVTAISGSGPAYVYLFAQGLMKAAQSLGLKSGREMVIQTLMGATTLLDQSGADTEALIKQVASKGGTTEAALNSLRADQFEKTIGRAAKKAFARSKALAQLLGNN